MPMESRDALAVSQHLNLQDILELRRQSLASIVGGSRMGCSASRRAAEACQSFEPERTK